MAKKNNPLSDVFGFVQKAATDAVNAAGNIGESVKDGIVSAANSVGSAVNDAANKVSRQTVKIADLNGDGKLGQEDIMIALGSIYAKAIDGIPGISKPIEAFSADYLNNAPNEKAAARKMLDNAIIKCTTSGFLTGFGGLITLPVTLPASVTSVIYVQIRMIASVAYMAGLDVRSDAVQTLTYACLAGVSIAEVVKKTGMALGTKMTMALVKKIPGKTLTKINQKVGFRFLTKFGEKGLINIGKMIPVVGALISGGFDLAETKIIADRAYKEFMEGQFVIEGVMDEIEDEADSAIVDE